MKKVNQLLDQIQPIRREINTRCLAYLKRVLKNAESHRINFYNEESGEYVGSEFVCVTYDGGNHPEYASNAFSTVNAIYLDDKGHIMLDTEDSSCYEIDSITWDEVIDLADYVYRVVMPILKKG
jgi:hypothetical protein